MEQTLASELSTNVKVMAGIRSRRAGGPNGDSHGAPQIDRCQSEDRPDGYLLRSVLNDAQNEFPLQ